ncbi:MAG: hypothetical protein D6773_08425, partial [Alphaproteobacteria bacterium]
MKTSYQSCALSRLALAFLWLGLALAMPPALHAQEVSSAFGGLADNSNQPIDIESDSLEVLDAKNIAIFRGN